MKTRLLFCLIIIALAFSNKAQAITYYWTGGNGTWKTSGNWLNSNTGTNTGYPGFTNTADVAIISSASSPTVTLASNLTYSISSLQNFANTSGTVSLSSGVNLQVTGGLTLNQSYSTAQVGLTFLGAGSVTVGGTTTYGQYCQIVVGSTSSLTTTFNFAAGATVTTNDNNAKITNFGKLNFLGTTASPVTINFQNQNSVITNTGTASADATIFNFTANATGIANSTGGVFTVDAGSVINVSGFTAYLRNAGTFYAGTTGSICTVQLYGQPADQTTGADLYNNGTFYLGSTSTILFTTSFKSSMYNTGTFTLQSNVNGSAAIGELSVANQQLITGTYRVERFIQGGNGYANGRWTSRNYRLLSSPVNLGLNSTKYPYSLNYVAEKTLVTKAISTYSPTATGLNNSLFLYNEKYTPSTANFTAGNFIGVTNISNLTAAGNLTTTDASNPTAKIYAGQGFMLYFRGDNINSIGTSPGKTTAPYVAPEDVTLTAFGSLNQGDVYVNSWTNYNGLLWTQANPGNAAVRGFNLVGNPYACTIDWDTFGTGITGANVNPTIYTFDPINSRYGTFNATTNAITNGGSQYIVSGQGFFVQTNNNSSSLTFKESCKLPTKQVTGPTNLFMGKPIITDNVYTNFLRLNLNKDKESNDIVVGFHSGSDESYNPVEDDRLLPGAGPAMTISTKSSDDVNLVANWISLPKAKETKVIKVSVTATNSGLYTLQKAELNNMADYYEVWLMDNYKKDSLDLKHNSTYNFNIVKTDTSSFGNNRFKIIVRRDQQKNLRLLDFAGVKVTDGVKLNWNTENEYNVTNFTVEKSIDNGKTFEVVGGFRSSASGSYNLIDKKPVTGVNQYRLKQDDLDGAITYSKIVNIMYANTNDRTITADISIYPNPVSSTLSVTLNNYAEIKAYSIKITNSSGIIVKSQTASQPSWQGNVSNLLPGTYVVQVTNNETKKIIGNGKFIKQ